MSVVRIRGTGGPRTIHFCWIGPRLPWPYAFSVASAAAAAQVDRVVLHHTDTLTEDAALAFVRSCPAVEVLGLDGEPYLREAGAALGLGTALAELYGNLERPVSRCDLLRLALLYREGGIYLDLDTITRRPLGSLLDGGSFVGTEWIVWPAAVRRSRNPLRWTRALGLDLLRKLARWHPEGWRHFRRISPLYWRALNNAVMGGPRGSPLFAACLRAVAAMAPDRANEAFALGPDLLEAVVATLPDADRPRLEAPEVFYPLAPEISDHWFRDRNRVDLDAVLPVGNRVVHWYASVRTRTRIAGIDPAYVWRRRDREFYSALVCDSVPLPAADASLGACP